MKNANHIISSLFANPAYSHIGERIQMRQSLEKLKLALPLHMQKNIIRITYKPPKLLFCFTHPSYANEFNHYKTNEIISCLKTYKEHFKSIQFPLEIKGYVPKALLVDSTAINQPQEIHFKEHSKGEFTNLATNKEVFEKFEEIRALIRHINEMQDD